MIKFMFLIAAALLLTGCGGRDLVGDGIPMHEEIGENLGKLWVSGESSLYCEMSSERLDYCDNVQILDKAEFGGIEFFQVELGNEEFPNAFWIEAQYFD